MQNNDFHYIQQLINDYGNSIIDDEQLRDILSNSNYKDLIGMEGEFNLISFNQKNDKKKILTFKINKKQYDVISVLINGKWKIFIDDLIVPNYKVIVPGETKLFWNDKEIPHDKFSEIDESNKMLDVYTITCIPQEVTLKYVSTVFGEYKENVDVNSNNTEYKMLRDFNENQINESLESVKNLWNSMIIDCINNIDKNSFFDKYFCENINQDNKEKTYNDIKSLTSTVNLLKLELISLSKWENNFSGISKNDILTLNFKYKVQSTIFVSPVAVNEKQWDGTYIIKYIEQPPKVNISYEKLSNIRLKKIDEKTFKIYEITDNILFSTQ